MSIESSGNAKDIFLQAVEIESAEDREAFLGVLAEVVERYNWICHAYCLMKTYAKYLWWIAERRDPRYARAWTAAPRDASTRAAT